MFQRRRRKGWPSARVHSGSMLLLNEYALEIYWVELNACKVFHHYVHWTGNFYSRNLIFRFLCLYLRFVIFVWNTDWSWDVVCEARADTGTHRAAAQALLARVASCHQNSLPSHEIRWRYEAIWQWQTRYAIQNEGKYSLFDQIIAPNMFLVETNTISCSW